ncbi:phosphate ABC transporter permease [Candidatus Aquiluna sp. IMCC13023]|jgi:phosphate transport system permease protein|uniref:phosphate ABC transporter permease PstA n=1 Tax=Candidatus Aquiluna sp. IMCC13023 TaxID=1081644 RepID=UPI00025B45E8|nr:phosphate ABC transporter permease PstA [Candidatus Aquiluna sp. IMCC13023]EIC92380.1 phosphate ABC transporter permease [Candidatus Aquiluna sp. IMCC13023]
MTTQLNSSFRGTQDLPKWLSPTLLVSFFLASFGLQVLIASDSDSAAINFIPVAIFGLLGFTVAIYVISRVIEGVRKATDRLVTIMVSTAFSLALIPLLSLAYTVVTKGVARFDAEFFTFSMRNVVGEGGGALHAIIGTVEITGIATLISVPIGIMAAIYLVEYGRGTVARLVTFFVDVMTGVPSIVAGLFAYALFVIFFGPGVRMGLGGAIALSLLMIPVVIRATEEMLKIVPNELREAAYALGVPKWLTVLKVVLPTSLAGIATGIMIAIARVIGETAPLLLIAGFTASMNYNPLNERMMTLPVFVYTSYANQGVDMQAYLDRAWAGALTLMLIVMVLNLVARLISKYFSPKG